MDGAATGAQATLIKMEKLKILVEDIESGAEHAETAKMLQQVYDKTGFLPNVFDCISPPETECEIEDGNQHMCKPDEIDLWVVERWLHRDGKTLVLWVTTEMIRPAIITKDGKQLNL